MTRFTTGPINNPLVAGSRNTQKVVVLIDNQSSTTPSSVLIQGYILNGTRTLYVLENTPLSPNQVIRREYFANVDNYEFVLTTIGAAAENTQVSVWGKNNVNQLIDAHRLVTEENNTN